ncbi:hypothetical protein N665_0047s0051 [Sinapis alba]|nr:hypothetical protein N665_0047s0051 [Sinapis alba]
MMQVVEILRLMVAVSNFRIAILLDAVTLQTHTSLRIKFGLGPDEKLKFPSHQHETHVFRSWTVRYIHRKPLWHSGGEG